MPFNWKNSSLKVLCVAVAIVFYSMFAISAATAIKNFLQRPSPNIEHMIGRLIGALFLPGILFACGFSFWKLADRFDRE